MTNAQIAAAFEELADLYELDGAMQYRVIAYRTAASAVRDASVSVMQLAREGRATELPGIGKTLEEKLSALDETGDIPAAQRLRGAVPARADLDHAPARLRPQARAAALRRAGHRLARRAARRLRARTSCAACAASAPRSRRSSSRRSPRAPTARPAPRVLLSRALPVAEQIVGALRAHPARRARRGRRLAAPAGRRGQGPRRHRHRRRPRRRSCARSPSCRSSSPSRPSGDVGRARRSPTRA